MQYQLLFRGSVLVWGTQSFRTSTGSRAYQRPENQCVKGPGSIPEGYYKLMLKDQGVAKVNPKTCGLTPGVWYPNHSTRF